MDYAHFDAFTRAMGSVRETRRLVLRLLAGGVLGGLAARLGLTAVTDAKPKPKRKRKHRAARRAPGSVQAEGRTGKGKRGKGKPGKKKSKPKPQPSGTQPESCGPEEHRCPPAGPCVGPNTCCPGERRCPPDPDPWGEGKQACVDPATMCCPGERRCASGCLDLRACCPEERQCGPCDEAVCVNGTWVCSGQCCPHEKSCPGGGCVGQAKCCPGEKACAGGGCIPENACCPDAIPPLCTACEAEVCADGSLICRPNLECPPGWKTDTANCRCEQCEEVCPPQKMCSWPGCRANERCIEGSCNSICTNPNLPQLCCVKNEWIGHVYCACASADTICFNCGSAVCGCRPGTEDCCDPNIHGPNCPEECACQ